MEKNKETNPEHPEQSDNGSKNASYLKVVLIFSIVMAGVLFGLNYLFKHLF
jgi:hypothetical protein